MNVLRSLLAVLDVLLGGDHRRHGYEPVAQGPPPTIPPRKVLTTHPEAKPWKLEETMKEAGDL